MSNNFQTTPYNLIIGRSNKSYRADKNGMITGVLAADVVSLLNAGATAVAGPQKPDGFGWDFSAFPLNISGTGTGNFTTDFIPESYHAAAMTGTTYYVDGVNGLDSNTGLTSYATAVKTIGIAIGKGNTAGVPFNVMIKPGTYYRANGINGTQPTQKCALIADGGRVLTGTFDNLTWSGSPDGTYTSCYTVSRSNTNRVFDLLNKDRFGSYVELTYQTTPALANSNPGSWAINGSTLYVRRADGAAVTSTNTRVYLYNVDIINLASPVDFLLTGSTPASGFDLEGGALGTLCCYTAAGAANIMARNCTFKYAGGVLLYTPVKGVRIDLLNGLAAFLNCESSCHTDDGFNIHNTNYASNGFVSRMLTVNCIGNNNGRGNSQSNNGLTAHENCQVIDVNGFYDTNFGGTCHNIANTQGWYVGTRAQRSQGDTSLGGNIYPTEFLIADSGQMWLDSTEAYAIPGGTAILTVAFGTLKKHNHVSIMGGEVAQGGPITSY